ncbi:MAG: DUF1934 domain-containing protein [Acutalibacteraceae bacterium]
MTLVSRQNIEGEREEIEMTALADFEGSEDDYFIIYTDEEGDLAGCVTTLHVENGNRITMTREGDYGSHMIIEKNVRHVSQNVTPYGMLAFGISALEVDSRVKDGNGTLRFKYSTDVDMRPLGEIEFQITLRQRNN